MIYAKLLWPPSVFTDQSIYWPLKYGFIGNQSLPKLTKGRPKNVSFTDRPIIPLGKFFYPPLQNMNILIVIDFTVNIVVAIVVVSIIVGPRNIILKYVQNQVSNS